MLPSASQRASRASDGRGLGGGTKGSEGYGEATMGSAQKVGVLCAHLRSLVLQVTGRHSPTAATTTTTSTTSTTSATTTTSSYY